MSTDPSLELQAAILAKLKADPQVSALVDGRIYDSVPPAPTFPYVAFGPVDVIEDDADCINAAAVYQQIDAWSRAVGFPEVKRVADAVRNALHGVDDETMPLPVNALVIFEHRQTTTFRDPDGLTNHSVLQFQASVERR